MVATKTKDVLGRVLRGTGFLAVVAALPFLVLRLVGLDNARPPVADTSCNSRNVPTGDVTRTYTRLSIHVKVPDDDWPELTRMLKVFADSNDWLFRDSSTSRPGVVETLGVEICPRDQSIIASLNEQRWASRDHAATPLPPQRGGVNVRLSGYATEAVWQSAAAGIVATLESRWPDGVTFLDGSGYEMDRPAFLRAPITPEQP
jgi:hypothetical protein